MVIPCKLCADHYVKIVEQIPITNGVLENNETLFKWTVDIHNMVNAQTNKREFTYKEALIFYTKTLPNNNQSIDDTIKGMVDIPTRLSNSLTRRILIVLNILILICVGLTILSKRSSQKLF